MNYDCIVIGGSTTAPGKILDMMSCVSEISDNNHPPVIICQHISETFLKIFINQIQKYSLSKRVSVACPGMRVERGHIYIVPPEEDVYGVSRGLFIRFRPSDHISGFRPSIDAMIESVAIEYRNKMIFILPGMGKDGTDGIERASHNGTLAVAVHSPEEGIANGMLKSAISNGNKGYSFYKIKKLFYRLFL